MNNRIEDFDAHCKNDFKDENDFPVEKGEVVYVYTFDNLYKVKIKSLKINDLEFAKVFTIKFETCENLNPFYIENKEYNYREEKIKDDDEICCCANSDYISKDLNTLREFIINHLIYVNNIHINKIKNTINESKKLLNNLEDSIEKLEEILIEENCNKTDVENRAKWVEENNYLLKFLINKV